MSQISKNYKGMYHPSNREMIINESKTGLHKQERLLVILTNVEADIYKNSEQLTTDHQCLTTPKM